MTLLIKRSALNRRFVRMEAVVLDTTKNGRDEWEIREDFRTLSRAREILKDQKRLDDVIEFAKEQKEALDDLTDDEFYKKIGLKD